MKKTTSTILLTLLSIHAVGADIRDAAFDASSKASEVIYDAGKSTTRQTIKVADFTREKLEALISKGLQSSYRASEKVAKEIVNLSEFSKPAFRLTADGIAMVFEVSGKATKSSLEVSRKIYVYLEPSSDKTEEFLTKIIDLAFEGTSEASELLTDINEFLSRVLEKPLDISTMTTEEIADLLSKATRMTHIEKLIELALDGTTKGSELLTDLNKFLSKVLEKPIDITGMTLEEILDLIEKASIESSKLTEILIGTDNLEKGTEYTGKGISLTSEGVGAAFYLVSQATSGISHLFDFNRRERAQVEAMVERGDIEGLEGLRDLIRHNINEQLENGEDLNLLLNDNLIDTYIKMRLTVPELDQKLESLYGLK
ncbi:hypothetical protein M902_0373 [Bacteriovorax sp. BAL6_X]|uniref:hypothetical protein n=1 Tax=Bacteriovorax sp. BAL6_X TaxID=1201290 RepID=UPI0003865D10|nr:hypothetical protein [Bacteriovorax sp. BAL6_X]EPZ49288.1 hypothetical protein M902_0373 [Bacteriovorax sp. BAL6_X]